MNKKNLVIFVLVIMSYLSCLFWSQIRYPMNFSIHWMANYDAPQSNEGGSRFYQPSKPAKI